MIWESSVKCIMITWINDSLSPECQVTTGHKPSPEPINGLVQDCSNSSADALELLQSCTKPSKLEQLERLHSEYTPHHPMITHSSYQIPSQNNKTKLQIWKICPKFKF